MREIKFRVWNDFIKKYETLQEVASRGAIMPRGNELKTTVNYPLIIEQFTGLHDKNGKEIYEGDIVEYNDEIKIKGIVKWIEDEALFSIHWESGKYGLFAGEDMSLYEVIGNIHEEVVE